MVDRLRASTDWGWSGGRSDQYVHDVVADETLVPGLRSAGLGVLSEESGLVGEGAVTVVVDPVDGSTNASRGVPWYATSLCAVDEEGPLGRSGGQPGDGGPVPGDPGSGERGSTDRRCGSSVPPRRRAVSPPHRAVPMATVVPLGAFDQAEPIGPSACSRLEQAIVGFSGYPPARAGWRQFRVLGAAALDLCAVADGTLDGFVDIDRAHGVWDYLGGLLVCREAGATVLDLFGEDLVVLDPAVRRAPVAAATPALGAELLDLLDLSGRPG